MKTQIKSITPAMAAEYLKHNNSNRPMREGLAEQYAIDMRKGNWVLNHQGIAFDDKGNLIDGQHRLQGIIYAGVPVTMLVATDIPEKINSGVTIFTMDTVDAGKKRTVGDQLTLHGVENGSLVAAVCGIIAMAASGNYTKLTTPSTRAIMSLYKPEISFAVQERSRIVGFRSCVVIGAIAFALKSDYEKVSEFYKLLVSGEGIFRTGQTSPIYTLRKFIQSSSFKAGGSSISRVRAVLVC